MTPMKFIVAFIMAFALVVCCAKAEANYWTDATIATAVATADNHWPSSPCYGREILDWHDIGPGHDQLANGAVDGSCLVNLYWQTIIKFTPVGRVYTCVLPCIIPSPSQVDRGRFLCAVLAHEFGHLSGLTFHPGYTKDGVEDIYHSPDPTSLMYVYVTNIPWDCKKAFPLTSAKPRDRLRP